MEQATNNNETDAAARPGQAKFIEKIRSDQFFFNPDWSYLERIPEERKKVLKEAALFKCCIDYFAEKMGYHVTFIEMFRARKGEITSWLLEKKFMSLKKHLEHIHTEVFRGNCCLLQEFERFIYYICLLLNDEEINLDLLKDARFLFERFCYCFEVHYKTLQFEKKFRDMKHLYSEESFAGYEKLLLGCRGIPEEMDAAIRNEEAKQAALQGAEPPKPKSEHSEPIALIA